MEFLRPSTNAILPSLIHYRANHDPDSPFALFPSHGDSWARITFSQFAHASHRFARAVRTPTNDGTRQVVGLIVDCDNILYATAIAGLTCGGMTAFPISQRMPAAAICHLLRVASVHHVLVTFSTLSALAGEILDTLAEEGHALKISELPTLGEVYSHFRSSGTDSDSDSTETLPEVPTFSNRVEVYLHSSGSTGMPKAIPYSHEFMCKMQYQDTYFSCPDNIVLFCGMVPTFHAIGFCFQLMFPLFTGQPVVLFAPQHPEPPVIPTPTTVLDAIRRSGSTAAILIPAFLVLWSHDPTAVETLCALNMIVFGGGPLAPEAGDKLVAAGCNLVGGYGLTEAGCVTKYHNISRGSDWLYFEMADNSTSRWVDQGEGLYELQLLASDTQALGHENLPDVRGYATQDLWIKHPHRKNLWKPVGRIDDVIIMANGEKTVPGPIEGALQAHPLVKAAVAFGRARDQIGVLVEPATAVGTDMSVEQFRNEIWPAVAAGNKLVPNYATVFKEMILVVPPGRTLQRTPKGVVSRKIAIKEYEAEINELYAITESAVHGSEQPAGWEEAAHIEEWLDRLSSQLVEHDIQRGVDIFMQGYDSLTATLLRRRILSAMKTSQNDSVVTASRKVTQDFLYIYPTIERMASAIIGYATGQQHLQSTEEEIDALLAKYGKGMKTLANSGNPLPDQARVLLTGSTGSLGSHILVQLLQDERLAHLYAYNRPSKMGESSALRHENAFRDRGLDTVELGSPKLTFLEGDAHEAKLGLSDYDYHVLLDSVDIVIHNAWQLDFNLGVAHFEKNIASTRALIDLAMNSSQASHARVIFTSSIAVARNWPIEQGEFPEVVQKTSEYCAGSGYGESKHVAEELLVSALRHGLQTTSVRIGQITGGRANGAWAVTDWLPILVKSSLAIRSLPDATGFVSWIACEAVAKALIETAFVNGAPPPTLNIRHPRPIHWTDVMNDVADALFQQSVSKTRLPLLPFDQWFSSIQVRGEALNTDELQYIPAVKLLSFFGRASDAEVAARVARLHDREALGVANLDIRRAQAVCPSLHTQPRLQPEDVTQWISYWRTRGFLTVL